MASKENQEALARLHTSIYKYNVYLGYDYSGYGNKGTSIFEKDILKLQQAINDLELYKKALDMVCEELAKRIIFEVDSGELTYSQLNVLKNNLINEYLKESDKND